MAPNQAHKVYAQQQVYTASPAKLVLMCYEHAISALNDAIRAIEENNVEKRWKANTKATEIITHLWSTLDMEGGGKIAENLDQLYNLMLSKLPEVDFKNSSDTARDIIKLLEPLRDAWRDLAKNYSEHDLAKARADAELTVPKPIEAIPVGTSPPAPAATIISDAATNPIPSPAQTPSRPMAGYGAMKPRNPAPPGSASTTFSA